MYEIRISEFKKKYKQRCKIWKNGWEELNDIATTLYPQAEYAELESLYERVLKIRKNTLGIGHHDVAVMILLI